MVSSLRTHLCVVFLQNVRFHIAHPCRPKLFLRTSQYITTFLVPPVRRSRFVVGVVLNYTSVDPKHARGGGRKREQFNSQTSWSGIRQHRAPDPPETASQGAKEPILGARQEPHIASHIWGKTGQRAETTCHGLGYTRSHFSYTVITHDIVFGLYIDFASMPASV